MSARAPGPAIESVEASAFTVPTEQPEQDGTLEWSQTTLLLVQARAGDSIGTVYSYTHPAAAEVVNGKLAEVVRGCDPLAAGRAWSAMWQAVRNFGQTGLVSMAISAIDVALWDLKARLLGRPLADVLDAVHDATPVYGSGGFCNYTDRQLAELLAGWVQAGIPRVKMKTGAGPGRDHWPSTAVWNPRPAGCCARTGPGPASDSRSAGPTWRSGGFSDPPPPYFWTLSTMKERR